MVFKMKGFIIILSFLLLSSGLSAQEDNRFFDTQESPRGWINNIQVCWENDDSFLITGAAFAGSFLGALIVSNYVVEEVHSSDPEKIMNSILHQLLYYFLGGVGGYFGGSLVASIACAVF